MSSFSLFSSEDPPEHEVATMLHTVVSVFKRNRISTLDSQDQNLANKYPEIIHLVPIVRLLMKWGKEKRYPGTLPRLKCEWFREKGGVLPFTRRTFHNYGRIYDHREHLQHLLDPKHLGHGLTYGAVNAIMAEVVGK